MGWAKRKLIEQAFSELALAGYEFDLSAEEVQDALVSLESMMATLIAQGTLVPYAFDSDGSADADSGLPLVANEAVYLQLSMRLAARKGKQLLPSSVANARTAMSALLTWSAHQQVQQQQLRSGTPLGAGQKFWRGTQRPFVTAPDTTPLQIAQDGGLSFNGG